MFEALLGRVALHHGRAYNLAALDLRWWQLRVCLLYLALLRVFEPDGVGCLLDPETLRVHHVSCAVNVV